MSNPFDYLRKRREEKEEKLRSDAAVNEEADKFEKQRKSERNQARKSQDLMVRDVLDQFAKAFNPGCGVSSPSDETTSSANLGWSVGYMWEDYQNAPNSISGWISYLEVQLEFSRDNKPVGFLCIEGFNRKKMHAALSRDGLIEVIRELFP